MSRNREVFAQTSSLQEKNRAILSRIMEEANGWIRFLGERPNSVAIIPFTLTGGEDLMEDLILKPLELFQRSGNDVRTVYLKKANIQQKHLVNRVIQKVNPNKIIESVQGDEDRQATELLTYLRLRPIERSTPPSVDDFF
jgi:hypothetical protein